MKTIILIVISLFLFAGAYADTATGSVIVSGTPNITINSPSADTWYNASFTINASISGAPIAATYRWENSSTNGAYTSLTYQGSGIWTKAFGITSVADGNYTFRINSTDAASHTDNDTVFIYIDDTDPVISSFELLEADDIHCSATLQASDFDCTATDNGESFGGSITEVITGLNTGSSGTKTATCTITDSASNTDTATTQYTVIGCGVSGGGGNSDETVEPTLVQQETAIVTAPEAVTEVAIIPANLEDVTSIVLQLSGGLTAAAVDVRTFAQPPAGASSVGKSVYKYLEITTDAPAGAITGAKIQFKVEKSWVEQQQTASDSVILMHYKGGSWQELRTNLLSEDANFYYYEAQTDSLSLFAITVRQAAGAGLITGSAISIPTIPLLSTDTLVLGLMAVVLIATIIISRMKSGKRKFRR